MIHKLDSRFVTLNLGVRDVVRESTVLVDATFDASCPESARFLFDLNV